MFEKRIAKSFLRLVGVENPSDYDISRFVSKFHIDKMKTSKKIMLGMSMPVVFSMIEYKLFGSYPEVKE